MAENPSDLSTRSAFTIPLLKRAEIVAQVMDDTDQRRTAERRARPHNSEWVPPPAALPFLLGGLGGLGLLRARHNA